MPRLILSSVLLIVCANLCAGGLYADCIDMDLDGYGDPASPDCIHPDLDCDDSNPRIHPGAIECCINGLDDDCDALSDLEDPDCAVCYYDVEIRVLENDIELTGQNAEVIVEGGGVGPIPTHWNDVYDGYFLCCLFCDIVWTAKARKTGDTVWYSKSIPPVSDFLTSYVEIHIDDLVPIWPGSAEAASEEKPLLGRRNPETALFYIVPALFLIGFWKRLSKSRTKKSIPRSQSACRPYLAYVSRASGPRSSRVEKA